MANSKKVFQAIGALALAGAIYRFGQLKGMLAKEEDTRMVKNSFDAIKEAKTAMENNQEFTVKWSTKDGTIKTEVKVPAEEAEEETVEETDYQPED